jgi:hypothetical protein
MLKFSNSKNLDGNKDEQASIYTILFHEWHRHATRVKNQTISREQGKKNQIMTMTNGMQ